MRKIDGELFDVTTLNKAHFNYLHQLFIDKSICTHFFSVEIIFKSIESREHSSRMDLYPLI